MQPQRQCLLACRDGRGVLDMSTLRVSILLSVLTTVGQGRSYAAGEMGRVAVSTMFHPRRSCRGGIPALILLALLHPPSSLHLLHLFQCVSATLVAVLCSHATVSW